MAKKKRKKKVLDLENGFKFPWINAGRQWNVLWLLIPIIGWFATLGYIKKILRRVAKGKVEGLPKFGSFWDNLGQGILLFVYLLPLWVLIWLIGAIPWLGWILSIFGWVCIFPYMFIHVIVTDKFVASFDFERWWKVVIGNFQEYLMAILKTLAYTIIYAILSLVLVGLPGLFLANRIFVADFYYHNK